ncbi:MAG TPA: hypothetical protein VIC08_15170 [Cellvibrionaceae bacterium]
MKPDLLPKRTAVIVDDRDGKTVSIDVRVLTRDGQTGVFMADRPEFPGQVARSSATFIPQLLLRLGLAVETTRFYRYVYTPEMGAQFGAFELSWQGNTLSSYKMRILNNLDEGMQVAHWITSATPVVISYGAARNLFSASLHERQIS